MVVATRTRQSRWPCHIVAVVSCLIIIILGQFVLFPFMLSAAVDSLTLQQLPTQLGMHGTSSNHRQRQRTLPDRPPDGTLNGIPLYLAQTTTGSHAHCVGDNYQIDSWKQRSCHFTNLCFNVTAKEFVLMASVEEYELSKKYLSERPFLHTSSTLLVSRGSTTAEAKTGVKTPSISLGGINLKWGKEGFRRLRWYPKIVWMSGEEPVPYYALPDWIVWMPFHSLNGANPGHLVWDDFLPMYTLMDMFQLLPHDQSENRFMPFPMRYVLPTNEEQQRGLWASCDVRQEKKAECQKMMNKFMPLFVGRDYPYNFSSTDDFEFTAASNTGIELVCARHGVAGIASLTDHGVNKMHGWVSEDYLITHNHGRGGNLLRFRNFMMQNMGLDDTRRPGASGRHRIVFSQKSSDIFVRSMDFERQIEIVRKRFPQVDVEAHVLKELDLVEQLRVVHDASIFVTLCGGGAVTGMFLPAGASVFLYYSEDSGFKNNKMTYQPALLDWDLFNAMSYLRVHWLPRNTMKTELDEEALVALIQHELELMDSNVFQ